MRLSEKVAVIAGSGAHMSRGTALLFAQEGAQVYLLARTPAASEETVALAALSTPSFGEAIRQVARHKRLSCPEEIAVKTNRAEWSIQFLWLLATEPEPEVLTDLCFAWMLSIGRVGTGTKITPLRVEYSQPRSCRSFT